MYYEGSRIVKGLVSMEPRELCVIEMCPYYGERDCMKSERNMYMFSKLVAQWLFSQDWLVADQGI